MLGWGMVVIGSVLVLSQAAAQRPWQAGVCVGLILVAAGALRLTEQRERQR